jgi:hypothetical protein
LQNVDIFMAIWNILLTFGICYDDLIHFVFIWYIFPVLASRTEKNLATLYSSAFDTSDTFQLFRASLRVPGLPDFSRCVLPKREKVPNEHKMYQMVIKYPECP